MTLKRRSEIGHMTEEAEWSEQIDDVSVYPVTAYEWSITRRGNGQTSWLANPYGR